MAVIARLGRLYDSSGVARAVASYSEELGATFVANYDESNNALFLADWAAPQIYLDGICLEFGLLVSKLFGPTDFKVCLTQAGTWEAKQTLGEQDKLLRLVDGVVIGA